MELHLIRHGETNWNSERRVQGQSESVLTDLGIEQAKSLGERIQHIEFDAIYCSSSVRTRQTAEHAFPAWSKPITYLDSLREIHMGEWEGRLYADIEAETPDSFRHFWHEPHKFDVAGAETFYELQARAMAAIATIQANHANERVALVSHGALIKSVLAHVEELAMEQLWTPPHMHNCAHNILAAKNDGRFSIVQYADQPYGEVRSGA